VVVTPAGRKRYLELLFPQILNYQIVDEYQLWKNTTNEEDLAYMDSLQEQYPGFVRARACGIPVSGNGSIHYFFKECTDDNTIYVRFDDDVVMLDTVDAFKSFLDFRIANKNYFLIYPTILNNAIVSHVLMRLGKIPRIEKTTYHVLDQAGWASPEFARQLHDYILAQPDLSSFRFGGKWDLLDNEQTSINGISWLGKEFRELCNGDVDPSEEPWLSASFPASKGLVNCIYGDYCIVHYSFFTQRELLDREGYTEKYKQKLAERNEGMFPSVPSDRQ
jgi:hypothetical protein